MSLHPSSYLFLVFNPLILLFFQHGIDLKSESRYQSCPPFCRFRNVIFHPVVLSGPSGPNVSGRPPSFSTRRKVCVVPRLTRRSKDAGETCPGFSSCRSLTHSRPETSLWCSPPLLIKGSRSTGLYHGGIGRTDEKVSRTLDFEVVLMGLSETWWLETGELEET